VVTHRFRSLLTRIVLTAGAATLVILGILAVGEWLRPARSPSAFSIRAIDCEPPAGLNHDEFLEQVHYYGQLPEVLDTREKVLHDRLRTAFLKHPRVEQVIEVTITGPAQVRVQATYRPEEPR